MRRTLSAFLVALVGLTATVAPVAAASAGKGTDWNQRDTAIYVVSTLNLLHTTKGHPDAEIFSHRMHVARYNVYADSSKASLYFVQLKRGDGSVAGVLAYQMGWVRPKAVTNFADRLNISRSSSEIRDAYSRDAKQLIGSFTSTLPS